MKPRILPFRQSYEPESALRFLVFTLIWLIVAFALFCAALLNDTVRSWLGWN